MTEDLFEDLLGEIKPTTEEIMERKLPHRNFSKVVIFLAIKSRSEDFIYEKDLRDFMRSSSTRNFIVLNELVSLAILRKVKTSGLVEYWFEMDKELHVPIIQKYFEKAKKILGISIKLKQASYSNNGNGDRRNLF